MQSSLLPEYPRVRLVAIAESNPKLRPRRPVRLVYMHHVNHHNHGNAPFDEDLAREFDKAFWCRIIAENAHFLGRMTFTDMKKLKLFVATVLNADSNDDGGGVRVVPVDGGNTSSDKDIYTHRIIYNLIDRKLEIPEPINTILKIRYNAYKQTVALNVKYGKGGHDDREKVIFNLDIYGVFVVMISIFISVHLVILVSKNFVFSPVTTTTSTNSDHYVTF